jgi:hypothetical protein
MGVFASRRTLAAVTFWMLAAALGMAALLKYEYTPAQAGAVAASWPQASSLTRHPGRPTLVMLAHPRCPCTRATLGELEIIAAQSGGRLDIHVVFLQSPAFDHRTDLWFRALELPGAHVTLDPRGKQIRLFGALASGHVLVYDARGELAFSGGITSARGHSGANIGRDAVIALARQERIGVAAMPVFGCSLHGPEVALR